MTTPSDTLPVLALRLFDATLPFHELEPSARSLLELAAGLYAVPLAHARKKPVRAVLNLVGSQAPQLEPDARATLAATLALGRRLIKRQHLDQFDLPAVQQRQALTLAALLRLAAALDQVEPGAAILEEVQPVEDRIWLVLSGPETAAAASALQPAARLWDKIGYPPFEILDPDQARLRRLPFPQPGERIDLQPDDVLSEAARKVMRYHFARVLQHEPGTRQGEDIEALHDMRVATRRLRAAFEVFADAFEPGYLKPYLKGLRATGRALGKVRDLDVFMEKAQHYLDSLPAAPSPTLLADEASAPDADASDDDQPAAAAQEPQPGAPAHAPTAPLAPLFEHWQAEREQARAEMLAYLDSPAYADFKRQFNIFLNTPGAGARRSLQSEPVPGQVSSGPAPVGPPTLVRELAPVLIYTRLAAARAYAPYLKDAPIERLHALRIEFKKLRYTLEYFQEVLGNQAREVINEIKLLQDHLGDLNDAQVATLLLSDFLTQAGQPQPVTSEVTLIAERPSLEGVASYLAFRHAERYRLLQTFEAAWRSHFASGRFRRNLAAAVSVL